MTTANSLIDEALLAIGQLAEGETPSPETAQSALRRLNSMVDSMNNESLTIYQIQDEVFTLPANTTTRTIGIGGQFNTVWPVKILDSTFVRDPVNAPGVDFDVAIINNAEYSGIPVKSVTGPYPQVIYYDRAYPLGTLYFWPVPVNSLSLHLSTWKPLHSFPGLTTALSLPPGYEEMLTFNLAVRLAPSFGVNASQEVRQIASESKRNLKRVNGQDEVMSLPRNLPGMSNGALGYWDFYRGGS